MKKLLKNINKQEIKKKAIMGAKAMIVRTVVRAVTNKQNRKRLYELCIR